MATESLQLSVVLPASPERVYGAWLDSSEHGTFTGGKASVDPRVGGSYTAWDGYIRGTTLELDPGRRILQSWRTDEFPADAPDSRLEVTLEPDGSGTRLTLRHDDVPEGLGKRYEEGWVANYLEPMKKHFANGATTAATVDAPAAAPAPKPKAVKRKAAARTARKPAKAPRKAAKKVAAKAKRTVKKVVRKAKAALRSVRKAAGRKTTKRRATPAKRTARKATAARRAVKRTPKRVARKPKRGGRGKKR